MADPHAHNHAAGNNQTDYSVSHILTGLAIGAGVIGAGIMLAPHILPALGVSSAGVAEEASLMIHNDPMGIAGGLNNILGLVPGIGGKLAEGGLFSAGVSAAIGIGGVLFGQFLETREDGNKSVKWGSVIKYGALITSALIAMPAILSSLSTGIIYLGMALNAADILTPAAVNSLIATVSTTIGGIGGNFAHNMFGLSGISAMLPHFLCCGAPFAPAALSAWFNRKKETPVAEATTSEHKYTDGSVTAEMITDGKLEADKPVNAKLLLKHRDGSPISADELAVVHTEKLHLFVADSSLKDYHHIHPQPTGEHGVLAFSFTPKTANNYSAWADFTMIKDGQNHKLRTEMPSASGRNIPPSIRANSSAEKNGLSFDWQSDPLQKDAATIVKVNVTDARGNPVSDLEPVMGAYAHLVGFSADGKSIIHTHPLDAEPQSATDRGGPNLRFHVEPDCSGATQFYLQVKRGGEDIYVPFGQQIKPPALATERTSLSHAAMGHAM